MPRIDSASRVMAAVPKDVFAALVEETSLVRWLPPSGMTGRFERFDASPGGACRMVLTYAGSTGSGKTGAGEDIVDTRYVEIVPDVRVVQAVDFVSDDPAFSGTMTMTWELSAEPAGTRVEVRAHDVPPGISREDHAVGMQSSLANLEAFLAARS